MAGKFQPPRELDFMQPQLWPEWKSRWERFRIASKLRDEDGEVQVASLIYSMGMQAETIFQTFTFTNDDEKKDHDVVMGKFDSYFVPTVNKIHERAKFHSRRQQAGENTETYIRTLFDLAKTCGYGGDQRDEQIRDQLVVGIRDRQTSEKLQLKDDLKLAEAIEICRSSELVQSQMRSQAECVEAVTARKPFKKNSKPKFEPPAKHQQQGKKCSNCAFVHRVSGVCPAKGKKCSFCGKMNHFQKACRKKQATLNEVQETPYDNDINTHDTFFLGAVDCPNTEPWLVTLNINQTDVQFKVDTGADVTCITEDTYNGMTSKPELRKSSVNLSSPAGPLTTLGQFTAETRHKGRVYSFPVHVINSQTSTSLLSRSVASSMGLVKLIENLNINHDVFGEFGLMKCEPIRIKMKPDAQPYNLVTPRRISEPLLKPVKDELQRMVANGIISPVTEPTDWCAPMVPVLKKNGKVRLCVDLKKLNQSVKREKFIMPTVDEIAAKMTNAKVFSTLDCSQSFWQLPIHEEDRKYTCFITPFGRFVFNRLPYGLNSSTEIFQRKLKELLTDISGVFVDIDDMLIYAENDAKHDETLREVMDRIQKSGLKLNKSKCRFKTDRVVYQGQVFTARGMTPDPTKVEAINNFQVPSNVEEVRRFVGMINYLARYLPNLSEELRPILELLKSDVAFLWSDQQQQAFIKVKELLSSHTVLAYYDMNKPTYVSADASSYGLGACLLQKFDEKFRPIAYASRSLTEAEKKWAQIDKECLALVWACEKFGHFLVGLPEFKLMTDHKPLVPLINSKDLDRTPLRVQRMLMRLMRFNAIAEYIPGKELVIADALSRSMDPTATSETSELSQDVEMYVADIQSQWPASDVMLQTIAGQTEKDTTLRKVAQTIQNGWPETIKEVPKDVQPFYASRQCLSTTQGIIVYLDRIVIPKSLQDDIISRLHAGHQGIQSCRKLAAQSVWWPTINVDIEKTIQTCAVCETNRASKPFEPLKPTVLPDGPWHKIGIDAFELDKVNYLVAVDYYSRYFEIMHLPDMTSRTTILKLKALFGRYGIPYEVRSDGAKQFVCKEFAEFSSTYNFKHEVSSPTYARSNGEAEAYVKIAKKCLRQDDPALSLLLYRSTPHAATGVAPATLFLGRQLRTTLPTMSTNLRPQWPDESTVRQRDATYKQNMAYFHDRRHGSKSEAAFNVGDRVRVKTDRETEWVPATVTSKTQYPRSYIVQTPNGRTLRRNTKHLTRSRAWTNTTTREPISNDRDALFRDFLDRRMKTFNTRSMENSSNTVNRDEHLPVNDSATTNSDNAVSNTENNIQTRTHHHVPPAATNEPATAVTTRSGRTVRAPSKLNL